jgi:hypothetical protein
MPQYALKLSQTARHLFFLMIDSTDHISGKAGLSPTVTLSKNGAAFASPAGAVTEISSGWYKLAGNATDENTAGPLLLHATGTGADPCDAIFEVVAYDPDDSVRLGLTALPNAAAGANGGLPTGNASGQVVVSSTATGAIAAASFAAGAIDAAAIATDAIGSAELAASAVTEIQAAVAAGSVAAVTGSVGSIAAGGIAAAAFAAGAIDAAAIATDAIGAAELAAAAATKIAGAIWDEARSGHVSAGTFGQGVASVQGNVTGSAASVTGAVGSVTGAVGSVAAAGIAAASFAAGAIDAAAIATDAITAAKIAADAIGASELGADAVTEIQSGLATAAALATVQADTDDLQTRLPAALVSGRIDASVGAMAANTVTAAAIAADAITAAKIADGAIDAATFAAGAIDAAAVATDAIGAAEFSQAAADKVWATAARALTDKAGFALSAAGIQAIWDALTAVLTTAGSIGKVLVDNVNAAITSRATPAQVNAEIVDALSVDTYAEPAAVPAATATLAAKLGWIFTLSRNKITQTVTTQLLRDDADSATIAASTVSDDSTTFTRGEWS